MDIKKGAKTSKNKADKKYWLFIISQNPSISEEYGITLWEYCIENNVGAMQYQEGVQSKYTRNINLIKEINEGDGVVAYLNESRIGGFGVVTKEFYENTDVNNGFDGTYGQRIDVSWEVTSFEGVEIIEIKNHLEKFPKNLYLATIHNIPKKDYNFFEALLENRILKPNKSEDESNSNINNLLHNKKQIIFYGPPGTGKTYTAREFAVIFIERSGQNI